jgi:hypothetical protein
MEEVDWEMRGMSEEGHVSWNWVTVHVCDATMMPCKAIAGKINYANKVTISK